MPRLRLEHMDLTQQTTNQSPVQMGSAFDLWDNAVDLPNGTYSNAGKTNTIPTFSVGANYEFTDHMSAYVRVNNGVHFANFDDVRCNTNGPLSAAVNSQLHGEPAAANGCRITKADSRFRIAIRISMHRFMTRSSAGLINTPVNLQNQPIGPPEIYGSTAKGVRLIGTVNPLADSDVRRSADLQDHG